MFNTVLKEKAFYFSYDIDLTLNMQKMLTQIKDGSDTKDHDPNYIAMKEAYPNAVGTIPQYVFNHNLLEEFSGIEYSPFKVPCIFGYVYVSSPQFKIGAKTDFYLVSRKDCRRPGRRFITRGLDTDGFAANYVETEHIFAHF